MFTWTSDMLSAWAGVLIVAIASVLVTLGGMVWIIFFRKNGRRRHKRHRSQKNENRPLNPTLAQVGGLPPPRESGETSKTRIPTLTTRP